ncbi:ScyD/ScyE family protein [Zunongwangia sp. F260]|uniref:ScyD/ScyE family protein n=1 Tax=Autumnicola lenta TaxID=3075593 RepID=A0ABU3CNF4_9FLAO|nr:ScyD/ScyE family protein [Zunongwangia sp. F260]MDT0647772.1 ScyD/ScyE family protein [Zunongwangia sp. F260]
MKNYSIKGILFLVAMVLSGCSNEDFPTEKAEDAKAEQKEGPAFMKYAEDSDGPLFDLATLPNNDILVADASLGITTINGNLLTSLPGITSIGVVGKGSLWATTGPAGAATEDSGQALYQVHNKRTEMVVNLFAFEEKNDPDGAGADSNPYSIMALNANKALVVDSGGNDLLRVDNKGNIEVMAIFPTELVSTQNIKDLSGCPGSGAPACNFPDMIPTEAVPTAVVVGPDGYYYVGELKGFPAPVGESNIWRISPDASGAMCGSTPDCAKAFDGGFTSIIDMVFDKNGMLYVAEMDEKAWLGAELGLGVGGTINVCDPVTLQCQEVATGIPLLTAITIDKDGNLWATRNALIPGIADIVQIPL